MAHVSGPTIDLPGRGTFLPSGTMCDDHPDRPAKRRICIEADSFGTEYADLCEECVDKLRAARKEETTGVCDWCKAGGYGEGEGVPIAPIRDPDEGMCGPVHYVCQSCRDKQNRALEAELRWMEARHPELFDC